MNYFETTRRRAGFTLAELLVVVALVAIVAAIVLNLKRSFSGAGRFLQVLEFSPDGNRVIGLFSDGSVTAWNVADGKQVQSLPALPDVMYLSSMAFSPDGRTLAHVHYDMQAGTSLVTLRDLATGDEQWVSKRWQSAAVAFSHDGKWLAVTDPGANELKLVSVADVDVETTLVPLQPGAAPGTANVMGLTFSPDDTEVCYSLAGGEVVRWNLKTQQADRVRLKSNTGVIFTGSQLAYSPNGATIAIAGVEVATTTTNPTRFDPKGRLKLLAASDMRVIEDKEDEFSTSLQAMPADYSPASFATFAGSEVKIVDARSLETQKVLPFENIVQAMCVHRHDKLIAVADSESIYLTDGTAQRKLVDYRPQVGGLLPLFIALSATFMVFAVMRKRRKTRTCVQCGKRWLPLDKLLDERCPDCRVTHQTTEQIAQHVRKQKRLWWRPLLYVLVINCGIALWLSSDGTGSGVIWRLIAWLIAVPFIAFALLVGLAVVIGRIRLRRFRKYRSLAYSLAAARKAAGSEGWIEEFGPITVWTDATSPLPVTAESIAGELDDCRRRLEALTGEACSPIRPILLMFFASTAAANRFVPGIGNNADHHALYLGPWADLGYVSLEMLRRRLSPLRTSIRSLLLIHASPTMHRTQPIWLRYGLNILVAAADEPGRRDAWRRTVAVWSREGALVSLAKLFKQRLTIFAQSASAALLPENHERMLKAHEQLSSLADYLCGEEAPPERRKQFAQLWREMQETGSIEKACAAAFTGGLSQLESDWKAWAATATFGPPVPAPPEIAEAAEQEVIPLALNQDAPVQERIKRIRALGDCGWSVGIEPLRELINDLRPDIRREAKRGLQFLLGRVDV